MNALLALDLLASATAEEKEVLTIQGMDGNAIDLHISSPKFSSPTPRTCILHLHGGGMSILSAKDPIYRVTRLRLAELGFTVIGVEFRNAAGKLGPFPFPAGLNDCMSSLEYIHCNKKVLNIGKVVVLGESGGGNLSIALAMYAKRLKKADSVSGVYALCPYIYGNYNFRSQIAGTFPASLQENDGLLLPRGVEMQIMTSLYLPEGEAPENNPLAWPYHADRADLTGLPPHVISVNELDPCRDEGLQFCEKLIEAGVTARSRVVPRTCHAGELLFMKYIPDVFAATLKDVDDFVCSL